MFLFAFAMVNVNAQNEHNGCHHSRNSLRIKPKRLSPFQLKNMENSIARSDTFDIVKYTVILDVTDYDGAFITGITRVDFTALEPNRTSITFDLKQLQVDSVKYLEEPAAFTQFEDQLQIQLSIAPDVGEEVYCDVYYKGNPYQDPNWGGFYHEQDYIYNLGIGLTTIPPNFGKVWYPCFDTFVERATYEYVVTSANNMRAFCQGELTNEVQLQGDTLQRTFVFDYEIPTHLSAIAVADYATDFSIHNGLEQDLDVTITAKTNQLEAAVESLQELPEAIDALEWWWGPYAWDRVGYVITTDGALEIPQNIAYPQNMLTSSAISNRRLLSHELGHHWWGDMTVMRIHNDMWMKEGPAEYSAHLVTEWVDGRDAFVEEVKDNHLYVLESAHLADEGFQTLSPIIDEEIYGVHTYNKGAMTFHNLRGYMGDSLFRQAMKGVIQTYPNNAISALELRDELTTQSGYDCGPFFDGWVFQPGFSVFVIDSVQTVGQADGTFEHTVFLQQKLREAEYYHENVPLEISAYGDDMFKQDYQIQGSGQYSQAIFSTDFAPDHIALNTNGVLMQSRTDYEYFVTETEGIQNLPYVDIRIGVDGITDTALVRVEHIWAAPDENNLAPYITDMSDRHYWNINGVWSPELWLDARISYNANNENSLDWDITNATEENLMLVWRADASHPWTIYPDYQLQAGNLFNGGGTIRITLLRQGDYALANGNVSAALESLNEIVFNVYPNPSQGEVSIQTKEQGTVQIYSITGSLVHKQRVSGSIQRLILTNLRNGQYLMVFEGDSGAISSSKFQLSR